jgi:hypothetical protein
LNSRELRVDRVAMRFGPLALTAALLVASSASAGERDPAAAEALYRQGREAATRGDLARACALFAESDRLDPAPGTVLNLADCEEKRGHVARAWELFIRANAMLGRGDERRAYSVKRAAALEARVPHVVVTLAGDAPAGATVYRDDVALGAGALGARIPVDPGEHAIVVRAPSRADATVRFSLKEGEERALVVSAGAERPDAPAPSPGSAPSRPEEEAREARPPTWRTVGFIAGGLGLAGLVVGATAGLMTIDKASTFRDHCHPYGCDRQGLDAASSGKTLALTSDLGFAFGAVGLAAGAYLLLTSPKSRTAVGLAPSVRGVDLRGAF